MIEIKKPKDVKLEHLRQVIDLIKSGDEVKTSRDKLHEYLLRADFISYKVQDNLIICTATLKNPFNSYKARVFGKAGASNPSNYEKELGYIATHSKHENQGHCSALLKVFFKKINHNSIYATTRKPAMVHILSKFSFKQIGKNYDENLKLMAFSATK